MYNTFKESDFIKQGEFTMKVEVFESSKVIIIYKTMKRHIRTLIGIK